MDNVATEQSPFTVMTLNTHFGRAIDTPWTTQVLEGSDIVLLQEVIKVDHERIQKNLGSVGLRLVAQNENSGLAIAVSERFNYKNSGHYVLQPKSTLAKAAKTVGLEQRFRERGILLANLKDSHTGKGLTVATAHPVVAVRPLARAAQVQTMTEIFARHYATGPFILGADMNHYPSPRKVDLSMAQKARLKAVSNTDPTCLLQDTRHSWLRHLGLPDAHLDTLLFRKLIEISSQTVMAQSDHRAIKASFTFFGDVAQ